jgi:hypothetical protein
MSKPLLKFHQILVVDQTSKMKPSKFLKLAQEADLNGDFELADYLDSQLVRTASVREAQWWKGLFGGAERGALEAGEKLGLQRELLGQGKLPLSQLEKVNPEEAATLKLLTDIRPGMPQKTVAHIPFVRSEKELEQIANALKERIRFLRSADEEVNKGIQELASTGKIADEKVRKKVFDEAIKQGLVQRNSKGRPEDIIAILKGEALKPEAVRQGLKPWINNTAKGAAALAAAGTAYGLYSAANQQNAQQPGAAYSDPGVAGSPFDDAGGAGVSGGVTPGMEQFPMQGQMQMGGGQGGYQGPTYNMPSASQSFQPMQGYQPANQIERTYNLPRTNDQAEPLYPRITPQQAMQNAMTEDQARRYRELMDQGGRPAAEPIVSPEVYGPTQEQAAEAGGLQYVTNPTEEIQMPIPGETAPTPAVQGVGQAINPLNPTGFNPQNPYNFNS